MPQLTDTTCDCSPATLCKVCIHGKRNGTPAYDRVTKVLDKVRGTGNLTTTTTGFGTTTTTRERKMTNPTTTTGKPPSAASERYMDNLLAERSGSGIDAIADVLAEHRANGTLTQRWVSTAIDTLKMLPRDPAGSSAPAPDRKATAGGYDAKAGDIHVIDGVFFRIAIAKAGHWYLNRYNLEGFDADGYAIGSWDYHPGGRNKVSTATLATAEQAAQFGHTHKRCVFCSTKIERAESLNVGYGPDCAAKYGLPWGA